MYAGGQEVCDDRCSWSGVLSVTTLAERKNAFADAVSRWSQIEPWLRVRSCTARVGLWC